MFCKEFLRSDPYLRINVKIYSLHTYIIHIHIFIILCYYVIYASYDMYAYNINYVRTLF